jgi:hypothetical protein
VKEEKGEGGKRRQEEKKRKSLREDGCERQV